MFPASLRRKMQYPQQPLATAVIADRAAPPSATHAAVIEVFAEQPRPKQAGEWLYAWLSGMLPATREPAPALAPALPWNLQDSLPQFEKDLARKGFSRKTRTMLSLQGGKESNRRKESK